MVRPPCHPWRSGAAASRCTWWARTRPPARSSTPAYAEGTLLGKRYADAEVGLELLCTKAGKGTLSLGGDARCR